MVTAATIYISLLGAEGLRRTALRCHENTSRLAAALAGIDGITVAFDTFFHEAIVQFDRPAREIVAALARHDMLAGYDLSTDYPEFGHALLVCATDMRTDDEISAYVAAVKDALSKSQAA